MKSAKISFRLALLPLLLAGSFANAGELETVQVQGSRVRTQTRITHQNVDRSTATDLRGVLKGDPSIQFGGGNTGTSQWMTIRGLGQDWVDIVTDNTTSDAQIFHHQSRSTLDPALVKIIGVEKGAGSASAGFGAVAGRVQAKTVDAADLLAEDRNFGMRVNAGVYSNKGYTHGMTVYGQGGGFDGLFSYNHNHLDQYKDGKGNRVEGSEADQNGFLGKVSYNFNPDHRITLSHRREQFKGDRSFRNEFIVFDRNPLMATVYNDDTTNLEYSGKNMGVVSNIDFNVFHKKITDDKQPLASPRNPARPDVRFGEVAVYGKTVTNGANLGLTSDISQLVKLKYGLNWRHTAVSNRTDKEQTKTDTGAYVEGIWNLHPLTLTTGLRYDHFSYNANRKHSKGTLNPSISAIWEIMPTLSLNAAYNTASRSPRLGEAAFAEGNPTPVSPDLKAEQAHHAEIGLKYHNGDFAVSGSVFNTRIRNYNDVVGRTQTSPGMLTSVGKLTNRGYDFNAAYRWRGLNAKIGMAYSTPKLNGEYIDNVAKAIPLGRNWTTALSYRFDNPKIEIGWKGSFTQARSYRTSNGTQIQRPGFGIHDIYLNWQPLRDDSLNINFAVENVGNVQYFHHSQRVGSTTMAGAGRDFRLSANYRF